MADCKTDNLPHVAIVEPPYSSADDHPTHDPRRGQQFLGYIVDALLQSPSWKSTALILTYDEHGGFFDHVAPPPTPEGAAEPWDVLGVRVPTIVASPFTPRTVVSEPFEHTSILKTIAERWNLEIPPEARASAAESEVSLGQLLRLHSEAGEGRAVDCDAQR